MKIGLARRGYSATGGAEAYLLRLAAELARRGHSPVLLADAPWPDEVRMKFDFCVTIEASGPRQFAEGVEAARANQKLDLLFSMERILSCDFYRAGDGVHAAWLERRARFEPAWKPFFRQMNPKHRQMMALERSLFTGGAKCVIANSKMVKREIEERFGGSHAKIEVIYNGLPTPPPAAAEARPETRVELGLTESDYVAIFVGSGWDRKGLRYAIEAVEQTPGVTLLIAGRGNASSYRASNRVRFLGPRSDIPRLLAAADVFILPTLYDPFSNASLEALAAGLPVITTTANGFSEIIQPGVEGEVVSEPDDVASLKAALQRWNDPAKRGAIRPQLLTLANRYSIEENVRQTLALMTPQG